MSASECPILIVEDDQHYVDLYAQILRDTYEVAVARTVDAAIQCIRERAFAAVLVDLKMPGNSGSEMGGLDFIPQLSALQPSANIVVITAYGTLDRALEAGRGGVSAFVQKPIDVDELQTVVRRAVTSYEQTRRYSMSASHALLLGTLDQVLEAFPVCVQRMRVRQHQRPPFLIENEYDVQDLLFTMLRPTFSDMEHEEHTRKNAGSEKRVDFVFRAMQAVLEVKCVRDKNHAKAIFDEVKIDIESYHAHDDCRHLIFFIYDPRLEVSDARKKMQDLSGWRTMKGKGIEVKVIIRPC
jgi:CheY-like chemotaxis protein